MLIFKSGTCDASPADAPARPVTTVADADATCPCAPTPPPPPAALDPLDCRYASNSTAAATTCLSTMAPLPSCAAGRRGAAASAAAARRSLRCAASASSEPRGVVAPPLRLLAAAGDSGRVEGSERRSWPALPPPNAAAMSAPSSWPWLGGRSGLVGVTKRSARLRAVAGEPGALELARCGRGALAGRTCDDGVCALVRCPAAAAL